MKKRYLTKVLLMLTVTAMLSGCNKTSESPDVNVTAQTEDTSDNKEAQPPEEKPVVETKTETGKSPVEEEKNTSLPEFYITTQSEQEEADGNVIVDTFDQIHIDGTNGSYPGLEKELDKLNGDIAAAQRQSEQKTVKEDRMIYVRRADRQVFSVACEHREYGSETDHVVTRGHSYLTDSGKELVLSDIVDDEEAFYARLANELSVVVTNKMMVVTEDYSMEPIDIREDMKYFLDRGEYGWVLDPQGVTFWFDTINAALSNVTVTVLFSDDVDGTIFNKDFISNAPGEWIMQIPGNYSQTCFDREDDGITDTISWILAETPDNEGNSYPSGIDVCINGRNYLSSEIIETYGGMIYGTTAMLVHKDNQTYFMAYYCEEAEPAFVTLSLTDDTVRPADTKSVYIGLSNDGQYVPTDPSAIRVYSDHGGDEITEYPPEIMSVDGNGMLTVHEVGGEVSGSFDTDEDADVISESDPQEEETIPEYFIYVISPDGYANLRTGPGTEYDIICQIPTGDSMEVYRETATDNKGNKWLKVAYWHSDGTPQPDGTDDPGMWETGWIAESQVE